MKENSLDSIKQAVTDTRAVVPPLLEKGKRQQPIDQKEIGIQFRQWIFQQKHIIEFDLDMAKAPYFKVFRTVADVWNAPPSPSKQRKMDAFTAICVEIARLETRQEKFDFIFEDWDELRDPIDVEDPRFKPIWKMFKQIQHPNTRIRLKRVNGRQII